MEGHILYIMSHYFAKAYIYLIQDGTSHYFYKLIVKNGALSKVIIKIIELYVNNHT